MKAYREPLGEAIENANAPGAASRSVGRRRPRPTSIVGTSRIPVPAASPVPAAARRPSATADGRVGDARGVEARSKPRAFHRPRGWTLLDAMTAPEPLALDVWAP